MSQARRRCPGRGSRSPRASSRALGRQHRQAHDRAAAVLLGAGDDRARPVGVELHVGAGGRRRTTATSRTRRRSPRSRAAHGRSRSARPPARASPCMPIGPNTWRVGLSSPSSISGAAAQLDRVHPERCRDLVHVLLDRPARLRRGRRADRARRLVVRVDELRVDVDVLDHVRADGVHRRDLGEEAALAAVRAAVEHQPAPPRDERAVAAATPVSSSIDDALAAVVGGDELLLAREHELDRAPAPCARARRRAPRSGSRTWRRSRRRAAGR